MHPIDCRCVVCLVDRSSFGTPEAKALRASVSDEQAARVVQRARELDAGNAGTDPLAEAIRHALKTRTFPLDPATGIGGLGLTEHDLADIARAHFAALLADKGAVEKVAEALTPGGVVVDTDLARAALDVITGLIGGEGE